MDLALDGRTVVVTGGTGGIGRAVVRKLGACGANVVFLGRDHEAARGVIDETPAANPPVFYPGDLADADSLAGLFETAAERFGRVDAAVGSGGPRGTGGFKPFTHMEASDLAAYFDFGSLPKLLLAHAAAQHMAPHGYGKIVLVTTDAGRVPTPGESMIGAAAASLVYAARALARELSRDGIRINVVGISLTTDTPAYDRHQANVAEEGADPSLRTSIFRTIEQRMPFGLASASEVADYVAFLVAPESDGMSGATLSVNRGGYFPTYA